MPGTWPSRVSGTYHIIQNPNHKRVIAASKYNQTKKENRVGPTYDRILPFSSFPSWTFARTVAVSFKGAHLTA